MNNGSGCYDQFAIVTLSDLPVFVTEKYGWGLRLIVIEMLIKSKTSRLVSVPRSSHATSAYRSFQTILANVSASEDKLSSWFESFHLVVVRSRGQLSVTVKSHHVVGWIGFVRTGSVERITRCLFVQYWLAIGIA